MLVTPSPIVTILSLVHSLNAFSGIAVTLFGIIILISSLQKEKAPVEMVVKLFGRVILVIPQHPKASTPIDVRVFDKVISLIGHR